MKGTRRHRYIAFHIHYENHDALMDHSQFLQVLRQQAMGLFSKSLKDLRLWIVSFDGTDGILKCDYLQKEAVIMLLQSIKIFGEKPVTISTSITSGTIHGLSKTKHKSK
jgi:RNase P/RNase MRP subunit POP5